MSVSALWSWRLATGFLGGQVHAVFRSMELSWFSIAKVQRIVSSLLSVAAPVWAALAGCCLSLSWYSVLKQLIVGSWDRPRLNSYIQVFAGILLILNCPVVQLAVWPYQELSWQLVGQHSDGNWSWVPEWLNSALPLKSSSNCCFKLRLGKRSFAHTWERLFHSTVPRVIPKWSTESCAGQPGEKQ